MTTTRYHYRTTTKRPRKADKGHSIIKLESWTQDPYGFGPRMAITCQCGKRYTGNGDRAYYSHSAHLKAMTESTTTDGLSNPAEDSTTTTKRSEPEMTNSPNTKTRKATTTTTTRKAPAKRTSAAGVTRKATVAKADAAKATTTTKAPAKATTKKATSLPHSGKGTTKKATTTKAPAKAAEKAPEKATTKAPEKATTKKATTKAPAKKLTTLSGVKHPGEHWGSIVAEAGTPFAELERTAGLTVGSVYRVVKHGASPSAFLTVMFARATDQDPAALWAEVSSYLLAEGEAQADKKLEEAAAKE